MSECPRLRLREVTRDAAGEISFDAANDFRGGDHVHAAGQIPGDIDAMMLGIIFRGIVAQRHGSRFPAAAFCAAGQGADGVDELMPWIRLPLR